MVKLAQNFLDPRKFPTGSLEIAPVRPSVRPLVTSFLGNGSKDFSDFLHGVGAL